MNWILMKFGNRMHNIMKNNRGKFQLNPVHGFQENDHHHLQPMRIFLKICHYVPLIIILLLAKAQIHLMHEYWYIGKMIVGDDGHFFENCELDWAETYHICSSWCYAFPVQVSLGSNAWFFRYSQFKFCILCKEQYAWEIWMWMENQQA